MSNSTQYDERIKQGASVCIFVYPRPSKRDVVVVAAAGAASKQASKQQSLGLHSHTRLVIDQSLPLLLSFLSHSFTKQQPFRRNFTWLVAVMIHKHRPMFTIRANLNCPIQRYVAKTKKKRGLCALLNDDFSFQRDTFFSFFLPSRYTLLQHYVFTTTCMHCNCSKHIRAVQVVLVLRPCCKSCTVTGNTRPTTRVGWIPCAKCVTICVKWVTIRYPN